MNLEQVRAFKDLNELPLVLFWDFGFIRPPTD
jgi:hypothetical protein